MQLAQDSAECFSSQLQFCRRTDSQLVPPCVTQRGQHCCLSSWITAGRRMLLFLVASILLKTALPSLPRLHR